MIFINKTEETPQSLLNFISTQKANNEPLTYENLKRDKNIKSFDDTLFEEQKGLCCYCMQLLSEHSYKRTREHFLPQSYFKLDEVNYYNLYLSCSDKDRDLTNNHSKATNTGHCDHSGKAKGDRLISKYIAHPNCESFFHYSFKGEILPRKINFVEWRNWTQKINLGYTLELFERNPETAEILAVIYILNLNERELVLKRKGIIDTILKKLPTLTTKQLCEKEIEEYKSFTHEGPKPFAGVALYFLNEHLKKL